MDNIGEYIWIIFIIFSIIASLLSNKKKEEQKRNNSSQNRPESKKTSTLEDTIRDIFGSENEDDVAKRPSSTSKTKDSHYNSHPQRRSANNYNNAESSDTWDPEAEFMQTSRDKTNAILDEQKRLAEKINKINAESSSILSNTGALNANIPEHPLNYKKDSYNKRRIVSLLKKPNSIKDLIIVQEILNKPKALSD